MKSQQFYVKIHERSSFHERSHLQAGPVINFRGWNDSHFGRNIQDGKILWSLVAIVTPAECVWVNLEDPALPSEMISPQL
jgi:hypothetical protein